MIIFVAANTTIAVAALALGIVALYKEPKNTAYQSFFIFIVGIAMSAAAKPFFQEDRNFLVFLLVWWGFELMILGVFSLACVSSDGKFDRRSLWSLASWFVLFVSMPILLVAASFRADPDVFFWRTYHDIFPIFALFMVAHLVISFISFMRRHSGTFGLPLYLARGLLLIALLGSTIICVADLILPAFGIYRFSTVSNFLALVILAIGSYGVARYGAGNGGMALRRGIPYFLSLISVTIIFFGVEFGVEKFFYQNDEMVDIIAAAAGALAFSPLRDCFNKFTDCVFFRNSYHFLTAVRDLGERLSVPLDRNALLATITEFFHLTIQPTETVFFTVSGTGLEAKLVSGLDADSAAAADYDSLAALFLGHPQGGMIVTDATRLFRAGVAGGESVNELIKERAARLGVAAVIPIVVRCETRMIMMIGHKCSGALLNRDDNEFLGFVARRAAIALENMELRELMEHQAEKFEERVTARTERLKSMYQSQAKFLADVSHEFKTPLAILKMHASVFAASENAEQKKSWYVMDTTLDRLTRLVGDFLDAAKTGTFREGLHKEAVMIEDLLLEARDDCAILAADKGVNLFLSSEKISVPGEWDKLKEVVLNLLGNALQHTGAGGSIFLSARESDGEAEIVVKDTGSGIPRENLPHIFERFYRIGEGGFDGTGIGLYLCRQIVERHGGTITAESQPGKGSCFVIRLSIFTGDP